MSMTTEMGQNPSQTKVIPVKSSVGLKKEELCLKMNLG